MFFGNWVKRSEYERHISKAFALGYAHGYAEGRKDAIWSRLTPNMIREAIGLPPINVDNAEERNITKKEVQNE